MSQRFLPTLTLAADGTATGSTEATALRHCKCPPFIRNQFNNPSTGSRSEYNRLSMTLVRHKPLTAEATVINNFRGAQGAEYRHGSRDGCLKGTRGAVLDAIEHWTADFNKPSIYWLNGLAGKGKGEVHRRTDVRGWTARGLLLLLTRFRGPEQPPLHLGAGCDSFVSNSHMHSENNIAAELSSDGTKRRK
jgi:hypothetical protein